jgi:hypothetical protein
LENKQGKKTMSVDLSDLIITTAAAIEKASQRDEDFRLHLGASQIGEPCRRKIWYGFRWFAKEVKSGRVNRLLENGNVQEARMVELLKKAGIEVDGQQVRVSFFGGHFGGSADGVVQNLPEAPGRLHVVEFKTFNRDNFREYVKNGIPEKHKAQMQIYMGGLGLERALYMPMNKDDDDIRPVRYEFSQTMFDELIKKAHGIVFASSPPPRINDRPEWYECKFCPMAGVCHRGEAPLKNCRTCVNSVPRADGTWRCALTDEVLTPEKQKQGCDKYVVHG